MSKRPFDNHHNGTAEERRAKRWALRELLYTKQGGVCWLCGLPMSLERGLGSKVGRKFATFDHVVPKSQGGTTYVTNLRLAHRMCNSARHHHYPESLTARKTELP